jgi:tetratricopeptide (TPR) repeat protein
MSEMPQSGLLGQLENIQSRLEAQEILLKSETEGLKEQLKLSREISELRSDLGKTVGSMKLLGLAGTVVVAVLGFVGYASLKSIVDDARKTTESAARDNIELSRAYALASGKQNDAAIEIFLRAFDRNPYDPSVLAPLLHAYDETENWEAAEEVIQRIERDLPKLKKITDPAVLNNIAVIRIQEGVQDPQKLADGVRWLEATRWKISPDDADGLTYLNVNFWLAALVKGNLQQAKAYASQISAARSSVLLDPWSKVRNWRFFKIWLSKNPRLEPQVREMWITQLDKLESFRKGGQAAGSAVPR